MQFLLNEVSTFAIIIPILTGLISYNRNPEAVLRVFLYFLFFGFSVDFGVWYVLNYSDYQSFKDILLELVLLFNYNIYSPVEAVFFFWFLSINTQRKVGESAKLAMKTMIPLWLILEIVLPRYIDTLRFSFFDPIYNVGVTFIGGMILLSFIEDNSSPFKKPFFWPLAGIFIYNLGTFFIMLLKPTDFAESLWFLHDVMNIIAYLFFSVGFWLRYKSPENSAVN